jgi:CAAX prenyl protease-like protein
MNRSSPDPGVALAGARRGGLLSRIQPAAYARVLPFAAFVAILAMTPLIESTWPEVGLSGWLHAARGIAAGILLVCFWSHYTDLHRFARITLSQALFAAGAGAALYAAWVHLDAPWMMLSASQRFEPLNGDLGAYAIPVTALRMLGLIVIVPIAEELFWRSFLLRWLTRPAFTTVDPRTVSRYAMWSTAILFAVEHNMWLAGLLAGVLFNWLYVRTRSLLAPLIAHGVANACLGAHILVYGRWDLW